MSFTKYLKYSLYLLPIILVWYFSKKGYIKHQVSNSNNIEPVEPIEPSHSHDYAYKRAYLNPVEKTSEHCRANKHNLECFSNCKTYHYKFPQCVYSQPKSVALVGEDGKESEHSKKIKSLEYY